MQTRLRSALIATPIVGTALVAAPAFAADDTLATAKATLLERVGSAEGIMIAVVVAVLAFAVLRKVFGK